MNRKDVSILLGNCIDKFDISLYSFLAPVLGPTFFPCHDHVMQLILTYATAIISLFARPCGAFFFGMYARYYGPLNALSYSLIGVAVTTVMIGCIPGYELIGWYAPFCLIIVRLVRGVCASGESTVAKLYIMENKEGHHALRVSYWYQSSSMMGIVLASGVSTIVISTYPHAWRYCFFMGGIIVVVAYYMRVMSASFSTQAPAVLYQGYAYDSMALLWVHKRNVIRIAVTTVFSHITYSVPFVFMNIFVPLVTDISLSTMMKCNTALLFFDMIAVPFVGYCTQRYNADRVMICASAVLSGTVVPLFYFLPSASLWYVLCVRLWIVVWGILFLCPLNVWCKRLFSKEDSYFLVGMGNALGAATLGHVTTPLCLWLWHVTGRVYCPAIYMALVMGITLCAIRTAVEK